MSEDILTKHTCNSCKISFTEDDADLYMPYRKNLCRECYRVIMKEAMRNWASRDINTYFRRALNTIRKWLISIFVCW